MSFLIVRPSIIAGFFVTALFQLPSTPPVKMGLWETNGTMKMIMPSMPSGMPGMGPRASKVRACLTPESYAKALAGQQRSDCVRSNESITPKQYIFDLSCHGGKETGHVEMYFDSHESAHSTVHMNASGGMTIDSTSTSTFVSSDCGSITPDKPQIVK